MSSDNYIYPIKALPMKNVPGGDTFNPSQFGTTGPRANTVTPGEGPEPVIPPFIPGPSIRTFTLSVTNMCEASTAKTSEATFTTSNASYAEIYADGVRLYSGPPFATGADLDFNRDPFFVTYPDLNRDIDVVLNVYGSTGYVSATRTIQLNRAVWKRVLVHNETPMEMIFGYCTNPASSSLLPCLTLETYNGKPDSIPGTLQSQEIAYPGICAFSTTNIVAHSV